MVVGKLMVKASVKPEVGQLPASDFALPIALSEMQELVYKRFRTLANRHHTESFVNKLLRSNPDSIHLPHFTTIRLASGAAFAFIAS